MTAGKITDSAERLNALGYRRVSRKHGIVARIDRPDWLQVLAASMFRVPADFIDPKTGAPTENWCDHYRRVHSKDTLQLAELDDPRSSSPRLLPHFLAVNDSHDDIGYVDPATLREIEPAKLPIDVIKFLLDASKRDIGGVEAVEILEKYGSAAAVSTAEKLRQLADQNRTAPDDFYGGQFWALEDIDLLRRAADELELEPKWIPYKPDDALPDVGYCWVVADLKFYAWQDPRVVLAQVNNDGKGGKIFYTYDHGSIDDCVTHYIPIATPELPK